MAGSDAKDRIIYPLEKRVVNPIVLLAWDLNLPPPGDALLKTTGRRTGGRGPCAQQHPRRLSGPSHPGKPSAPPSPWSAAGGDDLTRHRPSA